MGFNYESGNLAASSVLEASHINDIESALSKFLNEGIRHTELKNPLTYQKKSDLDFNSYEKEGWVDSENIFKPEFYGSPSPRMVSVSGVTAFRDSSDDFTNAVVLQGDVSGSSYSGVPGLCTRLKLQHDAFVNIHASFYAFELGGLASTRSLFNLSKGDPLPNAGYFGYTAANFRLFINGKPKTGTGRRIFISSLRPWSAAAGDNTAYPNQEEHEKSVTIPDFSEPGQYSTTEQVNDGQIFFNMLSRVQFSLSMCTQLNAGIHDIGIKCKPIQRGSDIPMELQQYSYNVDDIYSIADHYGLTPSDLPVFPNQKHIFVVARNFIVDAYYDKHTQY